MHILLLFALCFGVTKAVLRLTPDSVLGVTPGGVWAAYVFPGMQLI